MLPRTKYRARAGCMPAQRLIKGLVYQNGGRKPMYQGWCVCGTMIIALQDSTHSLSAVRQEVNLELVRINEASVLNYPLKMKMTKTKKKMSS